MKNRDIDKREINEKKFVSSVLDVNELNRLQNRFANASHLFVFSYSAQGNQLTEMTGSKEQIEWIKKSIGMQCFYAAYQRVLENELEDMIVEDTQYDNIKIGAVAVRIRKKMILCWIFVANITDFQKKAGGLGILEGIHTKTTYPDLLKAMDLMQYVSLQLFQTLDTAAEYGTEINRIQGTKERMKKAVERSEMTAKVVQFLEREDAMENVFQDFIELIGRHLELQSAHVFRLEGNRDMDIICEWYQKGTISYFGQKKQLERLSFLRGEKTTVISFDTKLSLTDKAAMDICKATGVVITPIAVSKIPDLYVTFVSAEEKMVWNPEDVKFLTDAAKVMQSIMIRKIQKNSLAVSYTSLEAILDHVGAAVLVEDKETGSILFVNKTTKSLFPKELQSGRLIEILSNGSKEVGQRQERYELFEVSHDIWLDVRKTNITWVDGRLVNLYAAYDITEKKEYQNKIELQAKTDYLTGLKNRMSCVQTLDAYLKKIKNKDRMQGAVVFIDMDNFKEVNDKLGHDVGDVLLKGVSNAFKSVKGIEENCFRMGGDEFVFIISPEQFGRVDEILYELQEVFQQSWKLRSIEYHCTMSMGVAFFPKDGSEVQELLMKADAAMYRAKRTGKNQMAYYQAADVELLEEKNS